MGLRPLSIGPGSGGQRANDEDAAMGSCLASEGALVARTALGRARFPRGFIGASLHSAEPTEWA